MKRGDGLALLKKRMCYGFREETVWHEDKRLMAVNYYEAWVINKFVNQSCDVINYAVLRRRIHH